MTTVSYLITAAEGENMLPYINLVVEDRDSAPLDTDRVFFGAMTGSETLGSALEVLLSTSVNGVRVFKPHIQIIETDYIVECALVGASDIGNLPKLEERLFSVHCLGVSSEIGNGLQVVIDVADGKSVQQARDYLQFVSADRNERRMAP